MKIKQFCKVCGNKFEINKEDVYTAIDTKSFADALSKPQYVYDAIDCPSCGCQKVLQIRMSRYDANG